MPDFPEIPPELREQPARKPPPKAGSREEAMAQLMRMAAIGTTFVFAVVAGVAIGWGFDHWLKTGPWGAVVGMALGLIGGAYRLIRDTLAAGKELREQEEHKGSRPPSR